MVDAFPFARGDADGAWSLVSSRCKKTLPVAEYRAAVSGLLSPGALTGWRLALDAEGSFLAVRVTGYANAGAYLSYIGPMPQTSPIFSATASPSDRRTSSFCGK